MSEEASFPDLMARLRAGDQEAATRVFNEFARRLIGLAHQRLSRHVVRKIAAEDLVQSVFKSFFRRYAAGDFQLDGWDSLWGMLVVITVRKCGRVSRYFHADCRNVEREITPPASGDGSRSDWEAIAGDPTPAEAGMLAELVEQLMIGLDEDERDMLGLRLQGYEIAEISVQTGRTERTVQRLLAR